MARVEPAHRVVGAAGGQRVEVVVDLPDRAARVVLPGQHEHGRAHGVDVGERRRRPVDLGLLLRRAAEQRPVERAQLLHLVGVGGEVVGHRHARDARRPPLRLRAHRQQREVAAPRPALDDAARRVGDALGDAAVEHRGDVLQLGEPGAALDRVAPGRAVAGRAAVVDLDDGEARVHPGGAGRAEAVLVGGVRAAVQAEHRGPGRPSPAPARRARAPSRRARPRGPRRAPSPARARRAARRARGRCRRGAARARSAAPRPTSRCTRPCRPGGPGRADAARRHRQLGQRRRWRGRSGTAGCGPRACARPAGTWRRGDQSAATSPGRSSAISVSVSATTSQISSSSRPRRSCSSSSRGSPGDGGEAERGEALAGAVGLLGDRAPVGHPHHPHVRVAGVAVLGVADREQGLVLGEAADAGVLGVSRRPPRRRRRRGAPRSACPSSVEVPAATTERPTSRPAG